MDSQRFKCGLVVFVAATLGIILNAATVAAQEWADLKMTFVYDGEPPVPKPINLGNQPFCSANGNKIYSERMLVNPDNGGIGNLAMWLVVEDVKVLKIHPDLVKVPDHKVRIEVKKCVFVPHVSVLRVGQSLEITNFDNTGHNVNFGCFKNQPMNLQLQPGACRDLKFLFPESSGVPFECNIHSWMRGYVFVKDHPYIGVSDEKGTLVIERLPAGEELKFRVWHENQHKAISEVTIDGKKEKWDRGQFKLTLKPGINDLGTIKLTPDRFK